MSTEVESVAKAPAKLGAEAEPEKLTDAEAHVPSVSEAEAGI